MDVVEKEIETTLKAKKSAIKNVAKFVDALEY